MIDQATKDRIEKEAYDSTIANYHTTDLETNEWYRGYIACATVWAEKLRQLETQSHDQVMIIEHLEGQLKQERNKAIDECIAKLSSTTEVRRLLESLKDKSHE